MEREAYIMPEARVGVRVADDRQTVAIQVGPVEGPSAPVALNLEQLTKLIKLLGQATHDGGIAETTSRRNDGRDHRGAALVCSGCSYRRLTPSV
jgi:hypothetical protein